LPQNLKRAMLWKRQFNCPMTGTLMPSWSRLL